MSAINRRDFLRTAGVGAGAVVFSCYISPEGLFGQTPPKQGIGSILREGVETGEFERVDPRETSRLLMISLVHFCHPVLVAQYLQDQEDLEADARATVCFLLRAITPRG